MNLSLPLQPTIIVIFGITGDLSQRYLLPALYNLLKDDLLHDMTEIVGISRRDVSVDQLLTDLRQHMEAARQTVNDDAMDKLRQQLRMVKMDLENGEAYNQLHEHLDAIEEQTGTCMNRLYYLSVPPTTYAPIIKQLGDAGLNKSCQHDRADTRVLIEKPFGFNLTSAQALIAETDKIFSEQQLFRIDHYLAKETVQNILTFRFQNPIFENVWDDDNIASIEIIASEHIGIEGRASFYEPLGALRDFIQSHLLQLLALITMDKPSSLDSEHIHDSKQRLLSQIKAVPQDAVLEQTVRGQYEDYREEVDNPASNTETFAAIKVFIDSPRWQHIPMILWTGKALTEKRTEICINFKNETQQAANRLRFFIQPQEGIELDLLTKKPGFETDLQPLAMGFSYEQQFGDHDHPNAYERVLVDAIKGDHTLFATGKEVLDAWRVVQPVLEVWEQSDENLPIYKKGTDGKTLVQPLLKTQE